MEKSRANLFKKFFCLFMACTSLSGYGEISQSLLDESIKALKDTIAQTEEQISKLKKLNANLNNHSDVVTITADGRLTLVSGVAVPGTDQIGATTIYFTPYQGSNITLYNGTIWQYFNLTEVSLTLTGLTTANNYDVFIYNNAGTLTLELSTAWTNATTRAQSLTLTNGVYIKTAATTRLYLGTIRTTGATTTEDSAAHRYVWNYFNRRRRVMSVNEAASNWAYNTAAWRSADADNTVRLQYVVGLNEPLLQVIVLIPTSAGAVNVAYSVGIGVDVTNANSAQVASAYGSSTDGSGTTQCEYRGYPGQGYHFLQWIEYGSASGATFYATDFSFKAGIFGYVEA